jgi:hypothetical protein
LIPLPRLRELFYPNAVAAGGRNEETNGEYTEGIQKIRIRAEGSTSKTLVLTKTERGFIVNLTGKITLRSKKNNIFIYKHQPFDRQFEKLIELFIQKEP